MEVVVSIGYQDKDNFFVSGTGVIIAPHLIITARHVIEDFINQFTNVRLEKNMKTGKENETIDHVNIFAAQYAENGNKIYVWRAYEIYFCLQSDIAFLYVLSANNESADYSWKKCKIDLNLPSVGARIVGFGFHNSTSKISVGEQGTSLHWDNSAATTIGKVVEIFPERRDSVRLNFPCFQTDAQFEGGMSGGPVFNEEGSLCGLICDSFPATNEFPEHVSYVTLLWPAMITQLKIPYPELLDKIPYPALLLAQMDAISAVGWEKISLQNVRGGSWFDSIAVSL